MTSNWSQTMNKTIIENINTHYRGDNENYSSEVKFYQSDEIADTYIKGHKIAIYKSAFIDIESDSNMKIEYNSLSNNNKQSNIIFNSKHL